MTGSKFGGYPYFIQEDPRDVEEYKGYTKLLLQIPSYSNGEIFINWGDDGVAAFLAREDQLKELDFKETLFTWDCG